MMSIQFDVLSQSQKYTRMQKVSMPQSNSYANVDSFFKT